MQTCCFLQPLGMNMVHTSNDLRKSFTFEGIDVFEFNEQGKIQEVRAYWNPAAVMVELEG